ncbi:TlpA family protein disulfide reductase [Flavisericum labens]|uniref:TlpA family protein disulfide reductase n=1 Tax=Flavisericum labens TaxID=3377112 RepID=UPI00387ADA16
MKKIMCGLLFVTFLSCNTQTPTQLSEEALNDTFVTLYGGSKSLKSVLGSHKGKTIFIDIWASWCGDCIKNMPKVKALQNEYKDVVYLFLSLDRGQKSWKKGIEKYDVEGEHYFIPSADDSAFAEFTDIDWIPRYMIVDGIGNIKLFKAVTADDERIKEYLN